MEKQYHLTLSAKNQASVLNLEIDKINHMVNHSARVTHELGNRRFHDFVFDVQDTEVFGVYLFTEKIYKCVPCHDRRKIAVFDECEHCHGVGCAQCDTGLVRRFIGCPACTKSHTKFTGKSI